MLFPEKKKKGRIINTGGNLPKANMITSIRFMEKREKIVPPKVRSQSRRTGNVIYGCNAVNALVGPSLERPTHDFDIFSPRPKEHAIELEKHIDKSMNSDIAYVVDAGYTEKGKTKRLFRVATRPFGKNEADYNRMPRNVKFIVKKGVRYETLDQAEDKYNRMLESGEKKRILPAHQDLGRIAMHRLSQRRRGLL